MPLHYTEIRSGIIAIFVVSRVDLLNPTHWASFQLKNSMESFVLTVCANLTTRYRHEPNSSTKTIYGELKNAVFIKDSLTGNVHLQPLPSRK